MPLEPRVIGKFAGYEGLVAPVDENREPDLCAPVSGLKTLSQGRYLRTNRLG